ncbi:Eukaryotic aspartyl protease family protein [Striga hermonthica]|uniref:Eukaryotic aspartyl protease family protein n=1 Tax=Striga hermonthica TaxID=68872 RepID=A0A9N7MGP3_STRHE|nr:Eukaryotic aspartyl protease family protein [Striga hermonthica]
MTNFNNSLLRFCCLLSSSLYVVLEARHYSFPTATAIISPSNSTTKLVFPLIHSLRPSHNIPNAITSNFPNQANYEIDVSQIIPDEEGMGFLVNILIGEPSVPVLLSMDTGSSLTWVQCLRCAGCTPAAPIYNPVVSSTYKPLLCRSKSQCLYHSEFSNCRGDYRCTYDVNYMDASASSGVLALEKFTFATSTGAASVFSDLAFGYGLESSGNLNGVNGILGLQVLNEGSLLPRVGNKFSYCLGNISDLNYPHSRLVLGSGIHDGFTTPLSILQGHYAVSLRGIGVGGKNLNIFNGRGFDYKMLVDSGTTLTYLERGVYEKVRGEVGGLLDERLRRFDTGGADILCYWGDLRRDLEGFPLITLVLEEGVQVYLGTESVFRRVNDTVFCLAMAVTTSRFGIIGAYAQQYYNIGFDVDAKRISFLSIECKLLDD